MMEKVGEVLERGRVFLFFFCVKNVHHSFQMEHLSFVSLSLSVCELMTH